MNIESLAGRDIGKYTFEFIVDGITLTTSIRVRDKIKIRSVHYQINEKQEIPMKFEATVNFPNLINKVLEVHEGKNLHFVIEAGFEKSKKKPQQVYVSLVKKSDNHLSQSALALYDSANDMYYSFFDVKNQIDHFNGEYDIEIHVADINAEVKEKWVVGTASLWFISGLDEGNNTGIKSEYLPGKIIEHIFPPEEPERSIIVSILI